MKKNLVTYILQNTKMTQKDLAAAIGVSGAQVSKWKSGESIPNERAEQLKEAAKIPDNYELLELAGSQDNIGMWVDHIQTEILPGLEFGLDDEFEDREMGELFLHMLLESFEGIGIPAPYPAPAAIDPQEEDIEPLFVNQTFHDLAFEIIENLSEIRFWIERSINYSHKLTDDNDLGNLELSIYWESFRIAVTHIYAKNHKIVDAAAFEQYSRSARLDVADLIHEYLQELKYGANLTPQVDLYNLLLKTPGELTEEVEFSHYIWSGDKFGDLTYKNTMSMLNALHEKLLELEQKVDALKDPGDGEPQNMGLGPMRFGENLKALRTLHKMSPKKLAIELLKLDLPTNESEIAEWELGPKIASTDAISALSKLFKVEPSDLIFGNI